MINTVSGAITPDMLGITLMHEHMVMGPSDWDNHPHGYGKDIIELADTVITALSEAGNYGVKTIIDASPHDLGRSIELDKIVADKTGINIIAVTGMYMQPHDIPPFTDENEITDQHYQKFMQELTIGIGDTGIKAGAIKVATSHKRIYPLEEAILKAAARASHDTGAPIITHTEDGTMGPEQADVLIHNGANPGKVVIGHACGNANLEYHVEILEKDVYLGFDRWGIGILYPDIMRKAAIIGLLGIGFADHIVLSHDHISEWIGQRPQLPPFIKPLMSNWSYAHIFKNIIPQLKEAGITDDQINTMLVENPKRIFQ